jgi:hypothetical protein
MFRYLLLGGFELLISIDKIVPAPIILGIIAEGTIKTCFYTKHIIQQTCMMFSCCEGIVVIAVSNIFL